MDLLELIWHVLNFCAPAVAVGVLLGMTLPDARAAAHG